MSESLTLEMMDTYESSSPEQQQEMDSMMQDMDMVVHIDLGTAEFSSDMEVDDMPLDMPQDTMGSMDTMFQDMDVGTMSFDEVMQEVSVAVAEIENVGMEVDAVEIKMPDTKEFVEVEIKSEPKIEVQQTQEAVEEQPKEVEVVEVVAEQPKEEVVKEETPKEEAPKEEIAEKEVKEEPVIEKVEKVEEQPKETAENKPTKEQVQKQKKAKRIMTAMASSYDPVSQLTTLALVNALGPDISTYSNQIPVVQPSWYETKEIYENTILPDPLGSYISVSSSLQMEKMVSQQYE
jgi:outer membrane biosynthesis protein TonB